MNARARLLLLSVSLVLGTSAAARADRHIITFDKGCNDADIPGSFMFGYKQVSSSVFASCGVASISSGGLSGMQQLAQSDATRMIAGVTGSVALAGAFDAGPGGILNGSPFTFGDVVIVFSPPVNEVAFDALDLDNATGLRIALSGAANAVIPATPEDSPTAQNGMVRYSRKSAIPIERVTVSYSETAGLGVLVDGWFLDQLDYNTWRCGDGDLDADTLNPALEECDDGNRVQCDGCNNACKVSPIGCFDASTGGCLLPNNVGGCALCDLATTPIEGNVPTTPRAAMTPCDDGAFCTLSDACDGAGRCVGTPNTCRDELVCTVDSCDEATDKCLHPIETKWCLIDGTCFSSGSVNPTNKCLVCAADSANTAWGKQPVGLQCGDPVCSNAIETAASSCDANGACVTGVMTTCQFPSCANESSCTGLCSGDQNCVEQAHCVAATKACVPDVPKSTQCTRNAECASNFCVDGVCCDKACNGACESCNLTGLAGTCSPLSEKAVDPEARCPMGQLCSADGKCTAEAPPVVTPMEPPPPLDVRAMGTGCDNNAQCGSAVCKDGVCCDRACDGVCESCNVLGKVPGQCAPYASGEDPEQECAGAGAVCSGESACTSYETRGNGLCAASPRAPGDEGRFGFATLLTALLALLGLRLRVRKRALGRSAGNAA